MQPPRNSNTHGVSLPLDRLLSSLRDEQKIAAEAGLKHLASAPRGHEGSLLLVSPTGTGKSYIQAAIHRAVREVYGKLIYSTFPSRDIAEPVFHKAYGVKPVGSDKVRLELLESHGFYSIKRLHNLLVDGAIPMPDYLQHDEAHHSTDDTHEIAHGVCGLCPRIGATATDYRGTPAETTKLKERWPRMHRVLTLKNAVLLGRLSMPTWNVWPLLDDETIDVQNGDFKVSSVTSHLSDVMDDFIERLRVFWSEDGWDRPTMIAVPGVDATEELVDRMRRAGLPARGVTGESSDAERKLAFESCLIRHTALVQVRVVGEGVDLPLRRLIDLAPTVSPVLWMQRVGRVTRPVGAGEEPPEYIACCHNLARHAYLWYGVMPPTVGKLITEAWGKDFKPSKRFLARAVDVEGLGRFQPAAIPFEDGTNGTMYVMQTKDGSGQYAVVLHPLRPDPWFFQRTIPFTGEMVKKEIRPGVEIEYRERDYDAPEAKWRSVSKLPELKGCITIKAGHLTDNQIVWWKRSAPNFGLAADAEITNREFQILPILANSGTRLRA